MTRTIEGYVTEWDDADQVGTYDDPCGGEDGSEPIETFVCVGENVDADDDERWAVIDMDAEGEGPGVISTYPTRHAAWARAALYCDLRENGLTLDDLLMAYRHRIVPKDETANIEAAIRVFAGIGMISGCDLSDHAGKVWAFRTRNREIEVQ